MLYKENLKETVLGVLNSRISSTASSIITLLENGYIPNKNKKTIISWSYILLQAYNHIEVFDSNTQKKLDKLFNRTSNL